MNISQLFNMLRSIPNIEIIVALLPKVLGPADQSARHALLQRFDRVRKFGVFGFAKEQMDVFRHDNIAVNAHPKTFSNPFQRNLKRIPGCRIDE